jgi:AraC family transcriptional regulator of adaptative response/methylated-DNA-[protein]-cysteine methyltransferase
MPKLPGKHQNHFARKIRIALVLIRRQTIPAMTTPAILLHGLDEEFPATAMRANFKPETNVPEPTATETDPRWSAVMARDPAHDGEFVFAVASTGVYCRPSCPSRRARRENVSFFDRPELAERAGYRACLRCRPQSGTGDRQLNAIKAICRHIEQNLDEPLTLQSLSKQFSISPFHLQRRFKAALGVTPRQYAEACRLRLLKTKLQTGGSVTRAMYDAGYNSSSRLYERAVAQLGMTPNQYRRGAIATAIRYRCLASPLGRMLIAATARGVCSIQFAASDEELIAGLRREFPFATRKYDDGELETWSESLLAAMRGEDSAARLPLDIRATVFQRRVWACLQKIPFGQTRSYSDVAKAIRQPRACRAVARACATNPVAVAIPCHRVVREDGDLGGYRWGVKRKQKLLKMERKNLGA